MTPEISVTDRDTELYALFMAIHEELHEVTRLLRKHDALLEEFRPVIERFRSPLGAYAAGRQARKTANGRP